MVRPNTFAGVTELVELADALGLCFGSAVGDICMLSNSVGVETIKENMCLERCVLSFKRQS